MAMLKAQVTSKIQDELSKTYKRIRDDIDLQFEHQLQLTESQEKVTRGVQSLEKLKEDLERTLQKVASQTTSLTLWLDENEAHAAVDPDLIVIPADALSKQAIDALADVQATEDALYYMDRALNNGEIPLQIFLKVCHESCRCVIARGAD